jgi:uncharacterized protein
MSQPAKPSESKVPEPSIDEILASIRRSIVPEDDAGKPAHRKPPSRKPASAAVPAGSKGRHGDDEAACNGANGAAAQGIGRAAGAAGAADGDDDGLRPSNGRARIGAVDPRRGDQNNGSGDCAAAAGPGGATATDPIAPLLSPRATAAVDVAFNSLTHTMLSQNPRTLEDLVRDMLRPMLKAWLDANLPAMVERLVRAEIERVSRRG